MQNRRAKKAKAQVGLLPELQAQMSIDPMGAIERDAHHNTILPKGVSLGNGNGGRGGGGGAHKSRSAW